MTAPVVASSLNGARPAFDVVAARAAVADETSQPFDFTLGEQAFQLRPIRRWPLAAQLAISAGDFDRALKMLLVGGADSWQRLLDAGVEFGDLEAIFTAASEQAGVGNLGNSVPPPQPGSTPT